MPDEVPQPYIVYLLWDPRNGDIRYVGKTKYPTRRLNWHQYGPKYGKGHCAAWKQELAKAGMHCEWAVVEDNLTFDESNTKEKWWIAYARQCDWPITNHTDGGEGTLGYTRSLEVREKDRQASLGHRLSPETRDKIRRALVGRLGHSTSLETREKLSRAGKGFKHSLQSRMNMRQGCARRAQKQKKGD